MSRTAVRLCVLALSALAIVPAQAASSDPAPTPPQETLMQGLDSGIRQAQLKRSQGDYEGTVRILSQLMLAAPDDPRVVGEYGKVLTQQGRAKSAVDFLTRAVQLQQNDWTLYSALGVAYDQIGDFKSARIAYERALSLDPGEPVILNNYALSRMLAGDINQAKKLIAMATVGAKDERIARNVKLIEELSPPAVAASAPPVAQATPEPVAVKPLAPPKAAAAEGAPAPLVKPAATARSDNATVTPKAVAAKPAAATQTAAPKTAAVKAEPGVIVQKVPFDPLAGQARPATLTAAKKAPAKAASAKPATVKATTVKAATATKPAPVKTAKTAKPAPSAVPGIPALRLANDRP